MGPQVHECRFKFGENWQQFAAQLHPDQIVQSGESLSQLLGRNELEGLTFLDIGCGSGLSSLVARERGARVRSFDFDPDSVACTQALRDRYYPDDPDWTVERGSILDRDYVVRLGKFDIVYSWGVLHHTGALWTALDHAADVVAPSGMLAIALYRHTPLCWAWHIEKWAYVALPPLGQSVIRGAYKAAFFAAKTAVGDNPFRYVQEYKSKRGMDWHYDVHDWLGGYPYESVKPEAVKSHMRHRGFSVVRTFEHPAGNGLFGTGCDEFVFRAQPATAAGASPALAESR
jgi:2-polyprenyl-6-hydroxyphenyl methylase/3-demethylubiquinone-9 3-methyltransferase